MITTFSLCLTANFHGVIPRLVFEHMGIVGADFSTGWISGLNPASVKRGKVKVLDCAQKQLSKVKLGYCFFLKTQYKLSNYLG